MLPSITCYPPSHHTPITCYPPSQTHSTSLGFVSVYEIGFQDRLISPFYNCKKITPAGISIHHVSEKVYSTYSYFRFHRYLLLTFVKLSCIGQPQTCSKLWSECAGVFKLSRDKSNNHFAGQVAISIVRLFNLFPSLAS